MWHQLEEALKVQPLSPQAVTFLSRWKALTPGQVTCFSDMVLVAQGVKASSSSFCMLQLCDITLQDEMKR